MNLLKNHTLNLCIFFAYALLITALSLKPHVDLGDAPYNDKVAHAIAYAIFTFLGWRISKQARQFWWIACGIVIYSGLIEVAQSYTGRTMSFYDLVANGIGALTCIIVVTLFTKTSDTH